MEQWIIGIIIGTLIGSIIVLWNEWDMKEKELGVGK